MSLWLAAAPVAAAAGASGDGRPPPRATADCPDPWDLDIARAEWAWTRADSRGINSPRIAILDAGFRADHVDLAGRIGSSWDHMAGQEALSVGGGPNPEHGSFCAGVAVAADNDVARTGFAPEARLHLAQIAGADGRLSMTAAVEALAGLAAGEPSTVGVVLIPWTTDNSSRTLQEAIAALESADLLVVSAAGHCGDGCDNPDLDSAPVYPAGWRMDHQLVVAATDRDDALAADSRTGQRSVDLGAPGVDLCSLGVDSPTAAAQGSDSGYAAAAVAGVAALVRGALPELSAPEVAALLRASAAPAPALVGLSRGGGRLDADRAFQASIPRLLIGDSSPGELVVEVEALGQDGDLVLIFEHHDEVFIDAVLEPAGYTVSALMPGDPVPLPDGALGEATQPGSRIEGPLPAGQTLRLRLSVAGSAPGTGSLRGGASSPGAAFMPTPIRGDTVDGNDAPALTVALQPLPTDDTDSGDGAPGPVPKAGCGCAQLPARSGLALALLPLLLSMARRKGGGGHDCGDDSGDDSPGSVRADKWLWAARCFKTRSQATEACDAGHCKINDSVAKPAQKLRPGDRVEIVCPAGRKIYEVVALGDRRGSAEAAAALFLDHTPPEPKVEKDLLFEIERGEGRPTKRDRRRLNRTRGW